MRLAVRAALSKPTNLLWIETPSNPLLRITDIEKFAALGRASGALTVVDNTFLSPAWQQPLTLGADLVRAFDDEVSQRSQRRRRRRGGRARDKALHEQLAWWANCLGVTGAPFDSFMTLRGLRTLHARLDHHGRNALALAQWLQQQPNVRKVYYPGLPSHPGHDVARASRRGFGAIVSLELDGGHDAVREFVCDLECFSLAESLGGVESLRGASGNDDARGDGSGGATEGRIGGWADTPVGRNRRAGGPAARTWLRVWSAACAESLRRPHR